MTYTTYNSSGHSELDKKELVDQILEMRVNADEDLDDAIFEKKYPELSAYINYLVSRNYKFQDLTRSELSTIILNQMTVELDEKTNPIN